LLDAAKNKEKIERNETRHIEEEERRKRRRSSRRAARVTYS
jgi:hypothetical protein